MALSATFIFYAHFSNAGAGATGLTVTATIKKLTRGSTPTVTTVTTGGAITVGSVVEVDSTNAKGLYAVGVSGLDPAADYVAAFHTAGTADLADIPTLWSEFSAAVNGGAIPQVAAGAANGLPLSVDGSGRVDVLKVNGTNQTANDLGAKLDVTISSRMATFTLPTNFSVLDLDISGRVNLGKVMGTVQTAKNLGNALPSAAPGDAGGLLIAGNNAATTFATLTSTGAFTINGTSHVAQSGDSYARIGVNGSGLTSLATGTDVAFLISQIGEIDADIAWDDAKPDPRTIQFLIWVEKVFQHWRTIAETTGRTHNYYFSQAGFDAQGTGASQGDGSQAHPWKTIVKLNGINTNDTAYFLKRGEDWSGEGVGIDLSGLSNQTLGAWGPANLPKPRVLGGGTATDGIAIGDSSSVCIVRDILSQDWGTSGSGADYSIRPVSTNTGVVICVDVEAYNGGRHAFSNSVSGGAGGGTTIMFRAVIGGSKTSDASIMSDYKDTGGQVLLMDSCVFAYGRNTNGSSAGCVRHCLSGQPGMLISRNLRVKASAMPITGPFNNQVPLTLPAIEDVIYFEIGTMFEAHVGGTVDFTLAQGIRINGNYWVTPAAEGSTGGALVSGYVINCLFIVDMANWVDVGNAGAWGFWSYYTGGGNTVQVSADHCHWHFRNIKAGRYVGPGDYAGILGTFTGITSFVLTNCIISKDSTSAGNLRTGLGNGTSARNAYFGVDAGVTGDAYDTDATKIDLLVSPLPGENVLAGDPLYASSGDPLDGVNLEYDMNGRLRSIGSSNIGPIEGGNFGQNIAAQLIAAQATQATIAGTITANLDATISSRGSATGQNALSTAVAAVQTTATQANNNAATAATKSTLIQADYMRRTDPVAALPNPAPSGYGAGAGLIGPGASANTFSFNNTTSGQPIADADVWITTDAAGLNVVAGTLQTDSDGNLVFMLDVGVIYYVWMQKDGTNPIKGAAYTAT